MAEIPPITPWMLEQMPGTTGRAASTLVRLSDLHAVPRPGKNRKRLPCCCTNVSSMPLFRAPYPLFPCLNLEQDPYRLFFLLQQRTLLCLGCHRNHSYQRIIPLAQLGTSLRTSIFNSVWRSWHILECGRMDTHETHTKNT